MDQLRELATAYLYGHLSSMEKAEFEQRLDSDHDLRRVLEQERELNSVLTRLPGTTARPQAEARFWRDFKAQKRARGRMQILSRVAIPVGAAAVVALALLIGFNNGGSGTGDPDGTPSIADGVDGPSDIRTGANGDDEGEIFVSEDDFYADDYFALGPGGKRRLDEALTESLIDLVRDDPELSFDDFVDPRILGLLDDDFEHWARVANNVEESLGAEYTREPTAFRGDRHPRGERGSNGFSPADMKRDLHERFDELKPKQRDLVEDLYMAMSNLKPEHRDLAFEFLRKESTLKTEDAERYEIAAETLHASIMRMKWVGMLRRISKDYLKDNPEIADRSRAEQFEALAQDIRFELFSKLYRIHLPNETLSEADLSPSQIAKTRTKINAARWETLRSTLSPELLEELSQLRDSDDGVDKARFAEISRSLLFFDLLSNEQVSQDPRVLNRILDFKLSRNGSKRRGGRPKGDGRDGPIPGEARPPSREGPGGGRRPNGGPNKGERDDMRPEERGPRGENRRRG